MTTRLRAEDGVALITSLVLMVTMVGFGLATLSTVDVQTEQSGATRQRETAFNLAEAAMSAQIGQLARDWPAGGSAVNQYPLCTKGSVSTRCPDAGQVLAQFTSADVDQSAGWSLAVRDNVAPETQNFYSDTLAQSAPRYDANGDGQLWVRSQATAKGRTRTLVGLVRAQEQAEDLPRGALISGRIDISNNGHKVLIDAQGGSSQSGLVAVRCTPALLEITPCLGHKLSGGLLGSALASLNALLNHQISPNIAQTGFGNAPAMTAEARARLKATAIANGTYYASGCPSAAGLSGAVVYIENGACVYTSNTQFNSPSEPGMVLMARGSLYLGGTTNFYGIIYHANEAGSTGQVMQTQGNATVTGGVLVDGNATTVVGSSKLNIRLDPNAFDAVKSYGSAGIVQNTWREIKG